MLICWSVMLPLTIVFAGSAGSGLPSEDLNSSSLSIKTCGNSISSTRRRLETSVAFTSRTESEDFAIFK